MRGITYTVLIIANIALTTAMAEEAYKWTDKNGVVHYGEFPPPNKRSQVIETPTTPVAAPTPDDMAQPENGTDSSLDRQKKQVEGMNEDRIKKREAKEKADKAKEQNAKSCNEWKNHATLFQEGGRIRTTGPDGKTHYLTNEEIAQKLAEAKKQIEKWCK